MAGLTPEEQAFFESGGDTSKLAGVPEYTALDTAGLGAEPEPVAVTPPVATPAPVVQATPAATPAPVVDPTEFLRTSLAESQRQLAELNAKIEAMSKPKEPDVVAPDPKTDPLGNLLHQLDQVNKRVAEMKVELTEQQSQRSQMDTFNRFQQQVLQLRNEFAATNPDFQDAYKHLRDARVADLKAYGFNDTDINKTLFQEEVALSQAAIQRGQNPAAALYDMAKRHGYMKPATPPPTTTAKLQQVKQGVESSPPTLPRTPVQEDISVESLREASDADLNKLVTDPAAWAKIAGTSHIPI